ncbi:MAG: hypothetical protein ACYTAF_08995 [Planctomycetota bacterium]|jgi:hypothetical protein
MRGLVASLLVLVLLPAQEGDPLEDIVADPHYHIRMAQLYAGVEESRPQALYHWERAWDYAGALGEDERLRVLKAIGTLQGQVPGNREGRFVNRWKIRGFVFRGVDWNGGRGGGGGGRGGWGGGARARPAKYRLSSEVLTALKNGFHKGVKRFEESSRGWMKVEAEFNVIDTDVQRLQSEGRDRTGWWLRPDDANKIRGLQWEPGDFDVVIGYLIGGPDGNNTIPFGGDIHFEWNLKDAAYLNYRWSPDDAVKNGGTGDREMQSLVWRARDALVYNAGYDEALIPQPTADRQGRDPDYEPEEGADLADFAEHVARVHMTGRMWMEAVHRPPSAPCQRDWLISPRYPIREEPGFAHAFIEEADPDLSTSKWTTVHSKEDKINLARKFGGRYENAVCYALAYVNARKQTWGRLYVSCDDAIKVFVNGAEVFAVDGDIRGREEAARLPLKKGRNVLLLKIVCHEGAWQFTARLTDHRGAASKTITARARK